MAEEIRDLIEKINQEGIKAAEEKASQIEADARKKAEEILHKAKQEAEKIIDAAKEEISRRQEKEKALLAQAGRDLILSLRKEIDDMLERLITSDLRAALNPETLQKIILELVRHGSHQKEEIVITLRKEDLETLEKGFLAKLKEETKKGITLKASMDIRAGFTISFDTGKSAYDFTDQSLAEYIGQYLKPKLAEILKGIS